MDRFELLSISSMMMMEKMVTHLKSRGLLNRPVG
jgi:hypothetical protein